MNKSKVLLTGVTGFLGSHTAIELLNRGYQVTGSLRDMKRVDAIQKVIANHTENISNLSFVQADLLDKEAWLKACENQDYVIHTASPFPRELPKDENDLIIPAKKGTLNVLQAAKLNKVKRVILVSSISTVVYGKQIDEMDTVFTEDNWTDVNNKQDTAPYMRSKTIAEKAAWNFIQEEGEGMELVSILPGAMLGPVLENDYGTSANIIVKILFGSMPAMPKIGFEIVDVRSVSKLLADAMEMEKAAGNRYMASEGHMSMKEVAEILKSHFPERKIRTANLPNFMARLLSIFEPALKPVLLDLGLKRMVDVSKAKRELGWKGHSMKQAVLDCANSVIELGIVK